MARTPKVALVTQKTAQLHLINALTGDMLSPDQMGSSASVAFATMTGDISPLGSDSKEGLELRSCAGTSGERLDRGGFVLMDIEQAVQFGGFQQIEDVDRGL